MSPEIGKFIPGKVFFHFNQGEGKYLRKSLLNCLSDMSQTNSYIFCVLGSTNTKQKISSSSGFSDHDAAKVFAVSTFLLYKIKLVFKIYMFHF